MKSWRIRSVGWLLLAFCLGALESAIGADVSDAYRLTLFPWYDLNEHFTLFAHLGTTWSPDRSSRVSNLISPGVYYKASSWLQVWGGLNNRYTQNSDQPNQFELRPFVGTKLFLPNDWKLHLYNFTRYELRATDNLDTHDWDIKHRIRSRFGAEIPLTSREKAWSPGTFYALANLEPFYTFGQHGINPLRAAGGLGYILRHNIQLEFYYYAQFTRPNGGSLEYTENIFRFNIKIGLNRKPAPLGPTPSF
jgi:hypothetical protein